MSVCSCGLYVGFAWFVCGLYVVSGMRRSLGVAGMWCGYPADWLADCLSVTQGALCVHTNTPRVRMHACLGVWVHTQQNSDFPCFFLLLVLFLFIWATDKKSRKVQLITLIEIIPGNHLTVYYPLTFYTYIYQSWSCVYITVSKALANEVGSVQWMFGQLLKLIYSYLYTHKYIVTYLLTWYANQSYV